MNITDKLNNTSIVIPFYRKYSELDFAIKFNAKHFEKVKEVLIILDEPYDITHFEYLKSYNSNLKFFINQDHHGWRNPCVTINHGIKNSQGKYIIVLSPETIIFNDAIDSLVSTVDDNNFVCGHILFMSYLNFMTFHNSTIKQIFNNAMLYDKLFIGPMPFGSICCTKHNFLNAGLYNENRYNKGWGGDDVEIRQALEKNGIKKIELPSANFIHLQEDIYKDARLMRKAHIREKKLEPVAPQKYNNFVLHDRGGGVPRISVNNPNIIDYSINSDLLPHYNIILLVQSYNEEKNVIDFLDSVNDFVDGIILLDDSSTDNTYNLFNINKYPKIIGKFKKNRKEFNDLENRSLLLDIYNSIIQQKITNTWVLWLDLDERLGDTKKVQYYLRKKLLEEKNINVLSLPFFHMWNSDRYNAEYPCGDNGVQKKYRIFKNLNNVAMYKFNLKTKLHFELVPSIFYENKEYSKNFGYLPLSIKHLGRITEELRLDKYQKYTTEYDKQKIQSNYNHFLNNNPSLKLFISNLYFLKEYGDNSMINPDVLDPKDGSDIRQFLIDHIQMGNTTFYFDFTAEEKQRLLDYEKTYPNNLAIKFAVNMINKSQRNDPSNQQIIEKIIDSLMETNPYIA